MRSHARFRHILPPFTASPAHIFGVIPYHFHICQCFKQIPRQFHIPYHSPQLTSIYFPGIPGRKRKPLMIGLPRLPINTIQTSVNARKHFFECCLPRFYAGYTHPHQRYLTHPGRPGTARSGEPPPLLTSPPPPPRACPLGPSPIFPAVSRLCIRPTNPPLPRRTARLGGGGAKRAC